MHMLYMLSILLPISKSLLAVFAFVIVETQSDIVPRDGKEGFQESHVGQYLSRVEDRVNKRL